MPPSENTNFRPGNFRQTGLIIKLTDDMIEPTWSIENVSTSGASGLGTGTSPLVPMCRHNTTSVSWQACHTGSQWSVQYDGNPRGTGFSGNDSARAPRSAHRRISAAPNAGSHSW